MPTKTKQEGIEQVIENNPTDYQRLLSFAEVWCQSRMKEFTVEELKIDFLRLHQPVQNFNVFGAVFNTLCKRGAISVNGHSKAKLALARSRELRVYVSREFRLKQQRNRNVQYQYPSLF